MNANLPTPFRRPLQCLLIAGLALAACDPGEDTEDVEYTEDIEESERAEVIGAEPPARLYDGDAFMLEGADVSPERVVIERGPLTLRYVGAHRYVVPDGDASAPSAEEAADTLAIDSGPELSGLRLIDADGREWAVDGFDAREVEALGRAYREGLTEVRDLAASDGHTNYGDVDDLVAGGDAVLAPTWTEYDCGWSTKWRFNNGSHFNLETMNNSQRRPILDFSPFSGTAVLIDDELALTAGHAANGVAAGDTLCRRYGDTGQQCRTVEETIVAGTSGDSDWGLIKFSSPFTGSWNYRLSDDRDGKINDYTPRIAAYPTIHRGEEASCGSSSFLEGERNLGTFHALRRKQARLNITAGGGSSGAPYYFYSSGDYWIFGIHSGRAKNTVGNRYAHGPKVPYWLDEIVASASTLGVSL